jgi:hypothetical protein
MKWILAILLLISASASGQIGRGDDSTKYIRYQNQYGTRMPRGWWDSVSHQPYGDTATFPKPSRPGAIMMHTNLVFYKWNGGGWVILEGSGGGSADSIIFSTNYRRDTAIANVRTQIAGKQPIGNYITALTGPVTAAGPGSAATSITNNAITDAMIRQSAGLSVIGNSTNSTANVADITAASDHQVLRRNGSSIGFGAVNLASSNAVTGLLPVVNTAAPKTYPAEHTWGTIYEKNSWSTLSDFTPMGTAKAVLNTGSVDITANTNDYTPVVRVLRSRPTALSKWKMTMRYRVTAWSGTSYWFGPIMKSLLTHGGAQFGVCGFSDATNSGGSGSYIITESGTILASGGGPSKSLNDVMEVTLSRNDTAIAYTIRNVTTSSATTTVNYSYPANHSEILPNLGTWGMMYNSTGTGNIRVDYIKIESDETMNPNILCLGDSKTAIGFADAYAGRWPALLQSSYPNVVYNAGSAEYITDAFSKIRELTQYNPQKVVMGFVGENDIRDGVAFDVVTANMKKLNDAFASGGTEVYWIGLPEDSTGAGPTVGANLSRLNQWVKAQWPNNYINTWDSLSTNNILKPAYNSGDNIHYTQAAMTKIAQTIIASGKLSTIYTNIRTPYRVTDNLIGTAGDSIFFKIPIRPKANLIAKFDNEDHGIVASNITDDGTNVIVSTTLNPTVPAGAILFNVNGAAATYGTSSGIYAFDRSTPGEYISLYKNGDSRFNQNGTEVGSINILGKWKIGFDINRQQHEGTLSIMQGYSYPGAQGQRGLSLNVDSSHYIATTAGNYNDGAIVSIARHSLEGTSPGVTYNSMSSLYIAGDPYAGLQMTITRPYALNVASGHVRMAGLDTATSATGGFLFKDAATGDIKLTAAPGGGSGITSINSETGSSQTIAAGTGVSVNTTTNTHTISLNTSFITAGTYTPTLTGVTNVTGTTAYACQYMRVGNVVTVSGKLNIDFTSTGLTEVGISLPIASSISNDFEVAGVGSTSENSNLTGAIGGDATNNRAHFGLFTGSSSSYNFYFTFTYQVL